MDQKKKDDQRKKNMVFLNGMLAAFVEVVVKECASKPDASTQTELIQHIREDLLQIMKKRLYDNRPRTCTSKNCQPPNFKCVGNVCMLANTATAFTWPEQT